MVHDREISTSPPRGAPSLADFAPRTIVVVGPGRLGKVMARALADARHAVEGPIGRGENAVRADIVLLCVPDREISAAAAAHARPGTLVGHTSGATPITEVDFGLHPLQTFTGDEGAEALHGVGCAVAGQTPEALAVASGLAQSLGAHPFRIADEHRAAYHAAASMASNFFVTLEAAAEQLLRHAVPDAEPHARELLAPLVRTTVENWVRLGATRALTGPIARGDDETVARQRVAVTETAPELRDLFDILVEHTRALARREQSG